MHRIARRSAAMILLVLLLVGGVSFFMVDYFLHGENWVMKEGSPHVYDGPNIGCGIVTDREGLLLLDTNEDRLYSKDALIRTSTLHWVGDRYGNISAPAVASYAKEMAGYDPITG